LNILEIGCGSGIFLEQVINAGHNGTGVEMSAPLATQARRISPKVNIINSSFEDASLDQASFDIVVAWDVLEHLPNQKHTFAKVERLLKPGGLFAAATINTSSINRKVFGSYWGFFIPPEHVVFYDFQGLKTRLDRDWDVEQIRSYFAPQLTLQGFAKLLSSKPRVTGLNYDLDHRILYIKAFLSMSLDFFLSRTSLGDIVEFHVRKRP
jgi:2-polyprenyl-3-methyl-5-hydroxy-6-metoxy-1,4-benzoquinol methylase